MPKQQQKIDHIFHALGDATRVAVVERLSRGPAPVGELARPFRMALPSFTQHLGVLEKSGLVRSAKTGRVRTYFLVPENLKSAQSWLKNQRKMWEKRLDQLDSYLQTIKEK
ncbi:MAG: metalloregulator ArsR/SmtB family transcription factor [Acidobacteriota bacterium]